MSVVIDITSQFTGQKAFRQAESAADKLGKTIKHALIGVGVTAFAKSAIDAFAQSEKGAALFAKTLRNIGFEYATKDSLAFLNNLKMQYGVVDEQLLPAYEQLITATRSVGAAQNLTNVALDIAAQQNISVTQAADALAKAYMGNTKGIAALGLGISKTTLASGNFADILKEITNITRGAASAAANTFAGKLARLSVAANQAKESIGAGLVEALMQLTKSQDIKQLQTRIINFGESAAAVFEKIGKFIGDNIALLKVFGAVMIAGFAITKVAAFITALEQVIKVVKVLRDSSIAAAIAEMFMINPIGGAAMAAVMLGVIAGIIKSVDILTDKANKATDALKGVTNPFNDGSDRGGAAKYAEGAAERAAKDAKEAAAAQRLAALAQQKAAKDQLAVAKAQALLKRSGTVLDIDQAQIYAALQGKITEQEKLRLDLQLALLTNNATAADQLSQQLLTSQLRTTELASTIASLPKALNPFADWPKYIQDLIAQMALLAKSIPGAPTVTPTTTTQNPYDAMFEKLKQQNIAAGIEPGAAAGLAASSSRLQAEADAYFKAHPEIDPMTGAIRSGFAGSAQATGASYTFNIDANNTIDPNSITKAVQDAILIINRNGLSQVPAGQGF